MAEEEGAAAGAGKGLDFLKKKIGPLPVAVWIVAFAGLWWLLQKRQASAAAATGTANGSQTDPAGNVGTIDPSTGYVQGSPEDQAAISSNNADTGTTSGSGSSTVAGTYNDNNAWASAAINYLVGIGIDPTSANSAIETFLGSQALTSQQQADVNSAIQRIGAPPTPPTPATAPTPIVTPPSGAVTATNPVTGLTVSSKAKNTIGLHWNKSTNATGYTVSYGTTSAATGGGTTVPGTQGGVTIGELKANTHYYFKVIATPAKSGAAGATTSGSTTK